VVPLADGRHARWLIDVLERSLRGSPCGVEYLGHFIGGGNIPVPLEEELTLYRDRVERALLLLVE
jgi:hypothetical protein